MKSELLFPLIGAVLSALGLLLKYAEFFYRIKKREKNRAVNLGSHELFLAVREWRHNIQRFDIPDNRQKKRATQILLNSMVDSIEATARKVVEQVRNNGPVDIIADHMDMVDKMYTGTISAGVPALFVEKFRRWAQDDEDLILDAIKRQAKSEHDSSSHLVDDVFKDYIVLYGMLLGNTTRLKHDYIVKMNGELDKILAEVRL